MTKLMSIIGKLLVSEKEESFTESGVFMCIKTRRAALAVKINGMNKKYALRFIIVEKVKHFF